MSGEKRVEATNDTTRVGDPPVEAREDKAHGLDRFPIKIASIATEYSRNVFPDAPITKVEGLDLSAKFEEMLLPHPNRNGEWGIIYNSSITSKGRVNFTLGHELGHYLLHRHLAEGFRVPAATCWIGNQSTARSMLRRTRSLLSS